MNLYLQNSCNIFVILTSAVKIRTMIIYKKKNNFIYLIFFNNGNYNL